MLVECLSVQFWFQLISYYNVLEIIIYHKSILIPWATFCIFIWYKNYSGSLCPCCLGLGNMLPISKRSLIASCCLSSQYIMLGLFYMSFNPYNDNLVNWILSPLTKQATENQNGKNKFACHLWPVRWDRISAPGLDSRASALHETPGTNLGP